MSKPGKSTLRKLAPALTLAFAMAAGTAAVIPQAAEAQTVVDVSNIVAQVMPAVVQVNSILPAGTPDEQGHPMPTEGEALGAGFVFDAAGRYVVTNNHVIEHGTDLKVTLADGTVMNATLVGTSKTADIAVLRVSGDNPLPQDNFGNSAEDPNGLRLGSAVIAIGSPLGLDHTVTTGIISHFNRRLDPANPLSHYLQTDASINRGNSGGPLFNMDGQVIGIDTAIISPKGGSIGLGFALPANQVKKVVEAILASPDHRVHFGAMNVVITPVNENVDHDGATKTVLKGIRIAGVQKGGAAAQAGLKAGDVIVALNGKAVKDVSNFQHNVVMMMAGADADVTYMRDGQEHHAQVILADAHLDKAEPAASTVVPPPANPRGVVIPGLPGLNGAK